MDSIQQISSSIATLIWPLMAVIVVWRLYPTIQKLIASRSFTVKVAGFEFTAQEATDKLVQSTAELQSRIAALDQRIASAPPSTPENGQGAVPDKSPGTTSYSPMGLYPRRVLWVDDVPDRRAYEIAQLESLGVTVTIARSTRAALDLITSRDFDVIVTSMSRSEDGAYSPTAGLTLLEGVKASSYSGALYVFATNLTPTMIDEVDASGGRVVTTSMQLFDALWTNQSTENSEGVTSVENKS